jgi:hypothetical protein
VADCYKGVHPAPIHCGFGFADWICAKVQEEKAALMYESLFHNRGLNFSKAKERLAKKERVWSLLDKDKVGPFVDLPELIEANRWEESPNGDGYQINQGSAHQCIRFLPDSRQDRWIPVAMEC